MEKTNVIKRPESNELVFERVFPAERSRVFGAFKTAEALANWWGPRGWETESKEMNFEPGGRWHYGMKCVDESQGEWFGKTSWGLMVYMDIDEPNSFTSIDYFSDETATIDESMPATTTVTTFEEVENGTKVTCTTTCQTREAYDQLVGTGMIEGLSETWDRLEEYVEGR